MKILNESLKQIWEEVVGSEISEEPDELKTDKDTSIEDATKMFNGYSGKEKTKVAVEELDYLARKVGRVGLFKLTDVEKHVYKMVSDYLKNGPEEVKEEETPEIEESAKGKFDTKTPDGKIR